VPIRRFGSGEAEAIGVAARLTARLLINERRAAEYASNLDIPIVTVLAVIVSLVDRDVISARAARRKLDLIEPITERQIIDQARRAIDLFES
jgi:predicted nucleic acid-binding protein